MRTLILIGAVIVAAAAMSLPAHAQNYPWCAQYGGRGMGGAMNCGFSTYRQCMADVSGIGGFCMRNNTYRPGRFHYR
jgi:hypothetical protein